MKYNVKDHMESNDWQFRTTGNMDAAIAGERQILFEVVKYIVDNWVELTKTEIVNMLTEYSQRRKFV